MNLIKHTILYIIVPISLIGCMSKNNNKPDSYKLAEKEVKQQVKKSHQGTIMFIVRLKTKLTEEELVRRAKERVPQFRALPGLIQKYYIKTKNPGEFGGVYIWDSMESFKKYKESDLVKSIAAAYEVTEPPSTELIDLMFELRD
ncbi:YdhR family protein [Seonamhaeicola maritimus]|uniref:YdhR family protein n=1 Tax=Seonamhaeicola maritimus TaxID=2591822 RepID=A0A5C7GFI9_9FLAO|nr:YdhR family protein [Seonamhaeicola maritimus]TXG35645.1 YdhR family protein [Seonamhaeicola maritimus]